LDRKLQDDFDVQWPPQTWCLFQLHQLDKDAEGESQAVHEPIWDMVGKIRYLADHSRLSAVQVVRFLERSSL
jgi:hypothetical protein